MTTRPPREVRHDRYLATLVNESDTPWGRSATWEITRDGQVVGKMYQGGGGYGDSARCSMSKLVWSGPIPDGSSDSRSPHYGMCFDTGPEDTREEALAAFAGRADRLIAWREENVAYLFVRVEREGAELRSISRPCAVSSREPGPRDVERLLRLAGYALGPVGAAARDDWPLDVVAYRSPRRDGVGRAGSQMQRYRCRLLSGDAK